MMPPIDTNLLRHPPRYLKKQSSAERAAAQSKPRYSLNLRRSFVSSVVSLASRVRHLKPAILIVFRP